jgi:IS5 family transposase
LPAVPVEAMLRVCFLQLWNSYTDPAMQKALQDTAVYRWPVFLDSDAFWLPDEFNIMRFRHFL